MWTPSRRVTTPALEKICEAPPGYEATLVTDGELRTDHRPLDIKSGASVMRVILTISVTGAELREFCERTGWSVEGRAMVVTRVVDDRGSTRKRKYAPEDADSAVILPTTITVEYTKQAGAKG